MAPVEEILKALKASFKSRGLTYKQVAKEMKLSEPTVKRLLASGALSLPRLQRMCEIAGVSIYDVTRLARLDAERETRLSLDQERFLAERPKHFTFFYLLLNQWKPAQIRRKYDFSEAESERCLLDLDKQGLLELHPGGKVKMLFDKSLDWVEGGPIRKMYEAEVKSEFLRRAFDARNDRLRFLHWELSEATAKTMLRRIDRFLKELEELASVDEVLTKEATESHAFLIGMRPWVFSAIARYRR